MEMYVFHLMIMLSTIGLFKAMFGVWEVALLFATPFLIIEMFAFMCDVLDIKVVKHDKR